MNQAGNRRSLPYVRSKRFFRYVGQVLIDSDSPEIKSGFPLVLSRDGTHNPVSLV
jgi:hypothetical protein